MWCSSVGASPSSNLNLSKRPSAPPLICELQMSSWCILEGVYEIDRRLADDSVHDRIWTLRGAFRRSSELIILEPNGCKGGFSDVLELVSYDERVTWQKGLWDRVRFRLKKDGSCDLSLLWPRLNNDPLEWAYSEGLMLVQNCENEKCTGKSLADLKPILITKYRVNVK
jgi:hypothetical protein